MSEKDVSRKLNQLLGNTMVHIHVGDDSKDFGVPKDLICHYSSYFKAAFNSGFQETITGVIKLPQVRLDVFELFYHWIYTQDLYLPVLDDESNPDTAENKTMVAGVQDHDAVYDSEREKADEFFYAHYGKCISKYYGKQLKLLSMLYIFADMTRIPSLQNHCIKKFYAVTNVSEHVPVELIGYIWENTTDDNKLRKLMIDMMVWEYYPGTYDFTDDPIPLIIQDEVLSTMRRHFRAAIDKKKGALNSPLRDITNYYVNVDEKGSQNAKLPRHISSMNHNSNKT